MTLYVLSVLAAYLLGSINGSLLLGRLRGVDIREQGSGNAGGTNALRTQGKAFAFGVVLIDIGKSYVAVAFLPSALVHALGSSGLLEGSTLPDASHNAWLAVSCALAAIVGHVYPIFHGFRGGKGVATVLGAVLALSPQVLGLMVGVWLLALAIFGYVGLGSMLATAALPVLAGFAVLGGWLPAADLAPWVSFGGACAAFVIFTHRSNIARMRAGLEPRAKSLWLLGKWRQPKV